ncbi:Exopolyphosphatase [Knufia peltigerae]|uniref:Exopolyphosphatase n=1 Tax=Knufia peltigerae TaxID=1002370 RepID=A0AA38XRA2_9EURO|nr:Exopolyphosphatase [Knufia peltigerae]
MPLLTTYLSRIRRVALSSPSSPASNLPMAQSSSPSSHSRGGGDTGRQGSVTLVMGNPSADLDSIISAIVLSYFYNNNNNTTKDTRRRRMYVPILNLPFVRSKELWRLRPEFGVALRLAMGEKPENVRRGGDGKRQSGDGQGKTAKMLEEILTIADVLDDQGSVLHKVFAAAVTSADEKQEVILVDHNAPSIPIPGLSDEVIRSRLEITGCIDHHVDEGYVSGDADPRMIRTGIGSCTSLVVQHLRDKGLWQPTTSAPSQEDNDHHLRDDADDDDGPRQMARLALAPILIDTSNLKAKGDKCSDLDREVVKFLESIVKHSNDGDGDFKGQGTTTTSEKTESGAKWDRDAFHEILSKSKTNSLDLLTMQEIFDRDYKSWAEHTKTAAAGVAAKNTETVNIGISSLVKPLSWLVRHAGGVKEFLDEVDRFAHDETRTLGIFAMLTRAGDGRKELVLLAMDHKIKGVVDNTFEARAGGELELKAWDEDGDLIQALDQRVVTGEQRQQQLASWEIWWMGDTSKSRKQVGPLVREVTRES